MERMESTSGNIQSSEINYNNSNENQTPSFIQDDIGSGCPKLSHQDLLAQFDYSNEILKYYLSLKEAWVENRRQGEQCWCDPRDLRMKTRLDQLSWSPRVVLKSIDDLDCVEDGTHGFSSKQTALDEKEQNGDSDDVRTMQNTDQGTDEAVEESQGGRDSFICGVNGCSQRFSSLASYESHYHTSHNFVCATCKRKFVSNFLLDIHLQENHDSYFQILSPRIDMYRCLVESCELKFRTPELRKDHLVTQHKYPASFSFHRPIKPKSKKSKGAATPSHTEDNSMESSVDSSLSLPSSSQPSSLSSATSQQSSAMEVETGDQQCGTASKQGRGKKGGRGRGKKVPPVICFGRGSQRAFQHRGRGGRGRHWHQMGAMDVDTTVDIEKVDFGDIADSLGECT